MSLYNTKFHENHREVAENAPNVYHKVEVHSPHNNQRTLTRNPKQIPRGDTLIPLIKHLYFFSFLCVGVVLASGGRRKFWRGIV